MKNLIISVFFVLLGIGVSVVAYLYKYDFLYLGTGGLFVLAFYFSGEKSEIDKKLSDISPKDNVRKFTPIADSSNKSIEHRLKVKRLNEDEANAAKKRDARGRFLKNNG